VKEATKDTWILTLVPAPGSAAPMAVRVKRLLKLMLRAFKIRCIQVSAPPAETHNTPTAPGNAIGGRNGS
jgi:hypothetical protein